MVMNVYERLHTTPPGWPASVALLLAHGAAVVVTVLALVLEPMVNGFKEGIESSRPSKAVETPLVFDCAGTPQFDGNAAPFPSNRVTLIASSPDSTELRDAFDAVLVADTNAALTLCGQTLFIAATNVGRAWETAAFKKLSGGQTSTLLERRHREWRYVSAHVRATAPDEETARRLAAEIEEYFNGRTPSAMGALLGELPLANGEPTGPASELPATGAIERKGRQITLRHLQFTRLDRGLPALLRFLCEQGCAPVRYGIDPQAQKE